MLHIKRIGWDIPCYKGLQLCIRRYHFEVLESRNNDGEPLILLNVGGQLMEGLIQVLYDTIEGKGLDYILDGQKSISAKKK